MYPFKLLYIHFLLFSICNFQLAFSQPINDFAANIVLSPYAENISKSSSKTLDSPWFIKNLYEFETKSSNEYYTIKQEYPNYVHDLFDLLQSNNKLNVDTVSKTISWKSKDFLEVQLNGKKIPFTTHHMYFYLKSIKSTDYTRIEIIENSNDILKTGYNTGIINIVR